MLIPHIWSQVGPSSILVTIATGMEQLTTTYATKLQLDHTSISQITKGFYL